MKKILLISTGGTIASMPTDEGLTPKINSKKLLEYLEQNGPIYMSSCNLSNAPVCKTIEDAKLIFPEIKNIYNFGKMTQQPSQIIRVEDGEILRK